MLVCLPENRNGPSEFLGTAPGEGGARRLGETPASRGSQGMQTSIVPAVLGSLAGGGGKGAPARPSGYEEGQRASDGALRYSAIHCHGLRA